MSRFDRQAKERLDQPAWVAVKNPDCSDRRLWPGNPSIRVIRVLHPPVKGLILAWLPGNLLSDGLFGYTYDSANRLTGVVSGTFTTEYLYNGDGVRVAQIEDGLRTGYVQDVAAPLPQVLTARQGGTVSKYLHGLGLIGQQQGGTGPQAGPAVWQYYLPDALGSVRQVTDPAGQVLLTRRYDPFGGLQTASGLVQSPYGFAGEEQDPASDRLFLRARTYNPATGRFLQADPVLGQLDRPASLHRYAYAFNNPVNVVDPSGLMPPGLGATRARRYAPTFGNLTLPDINYAASPPTQRSSGYTTPVNPWAAARSVNAAEAARSTYSDPYARQQSQGHLPKPCSLGNLLTGLFAPSSNGSLLHELAGFGLHAMQNGSLASDLGDWLGYNLATSYYQFEQWLANPTHFQLALGAVIIGAAIAVTGGAAIPVILMGAALGAGIGYGAQVFQNYQQGYSHLDALWNEINLAGIGQAAFHGAVSGAAAALIGAFLPGGGAGLVGALQTGLAEFVSGRVAQIALNMVSGQAWNQDLWNPLDIALDVLPGVGGSLFDTWRVGRAAAHAPTFSTLDEGIERGVASLGEVGPAGRAAANRRAGDQPGHAGVEDYLLKDIKKDLGIEGAIQPDHIDLIRQHPAIKAVIESGDLSTLRRVLGISEEGIAVPLAAQLNDLREGNFARDADLYKQAVLESGEEGIAFGRWAPGSGQGTNLSVSDVEGGAWHLQTELRELDNGKYMYTLDTQNELRYAPIPSEAVVPQRYMTHAQLVGGQFIFPSFSKKVWGAGEFEIKDGRIIVIDTNSGHFRPPPEFIIYTEAVFKSKGFNLEGAGFNTHPPQTVNQRVIQAIQKRIKRPLDKRGLWPKEWWPHIR